jgi:hypothetical protein
VNHLLKAVAAIVCSAPAIALAQQQHLLVANERTDARGFQGQEGRYMSFICPAGIGVAEEIWGTDVYLDDSAICTAAVHAGLFNPGTSRLVTILLGPGRESFTGTTRNGIRSQDYGPWNGTYRFTDGSVPGQIDWPTTFRNIPPDFGERMTFTCPPNGDLYYRIWGTDVYTYGSGICAAGAHAGVVSVSAGGTLTIEPAVPQPQFVASVRNGISSLAWESRTYETDPRPFRIVGSPTGTGAQGSGPTVRLAGFQGTGPVPPALVVRLTGFAGTGPAAAPLVVRPSGWTGTGGTGTP